MMVSKCYFTEKSGKRESKSLPHPSSLLRSSSVLTCCQAVPRHVHDKLCQQSYGHLECYTTSSWYHRSPRHATLTVIIQSTVRMKNNCLRCLLLSWYCCECDQAEICNMCCSAPYREKQTCQQMDKWGVLILSIQQSYYNEQLQTFNTLILSILWFIWSHRNTFIFIFLHNAHK